MGVGAGTVDSNRTGGSKIIATTFEEKVCEGGPRGSRREEKVVMGSYRVRRACQLRKVVEPRLKEDVDGWGLSEVVKRRVGDERDSPAWKGVSLGWGGCKAGGGGVWERPGLFRSLQNSCPVLNLPRAHSRPLVLVLDIWAPVSLSMKWVGLDQRVYSGVGKPFL